jgi:hypothetical protein
VPAIDLSDVPVVDNHCHAVQALQSFDGPAWRAFFTESPDPRMRVGEAADTAFYRRLVTAMGAFHGVPGEEAAVLAARSRLTAEELVARYFADASIGGLVVDTGYPLRTPRWPGRTSTRRAGPTGCRCCGWRSGSSN